MDAPRFARRRRAHWSRAARRTRHGSGQRLRRLRERVRRRAQRGLELRDSASSCSLCVTQKPWVELAKKASVAEVTDKQLEYLAVAELACITTTIRQAVARLAEGVARTPESIGADMMRHQVEVNEPGASPRTLTVIDEGDPDAPVMKPLLALLAVTGARP